MGLSSIEERVQRIAERTSIEYGVELVHTEVLGPSNNPIVRIYIDRPGGVTHEDCSAVSTHIGTILDLEDFIHSSYTLEVSSPGLERGLYKRADYERFAGCTVRLKTKQAIGGQRNFKGMLVAVEGDELVFDDRSSGNIRIPLLSIAKANLELDLEEELRRSKAG